jgi:hypothetical protein
MCDNIKIAIAPRSISVILATGCVHPATDNMISTTLLSENTEAALVTVSKVTDKSGAINKQKKRKKKGKRKRNCKSNQKYQSAVKDQECFRLWAVGPL